ncbi:MAG: hypothetical protein WKF97_24240 [Chitinophagaceae bacterium]
MYTSYIGRKFLKLYNDREGKNLSAREFFDDVLFPLFFDDDKHLMHVHGSTFFQKIGKEDINGGKKESLIRLARLHNDVSQGRKSGSTYVGYAAENVTEVTSGQVTSLDCMIDEEEIYASWIGQGFAVGLKGGLLLINEDEILWIIFTGWRFYRKFISQTPNIKSRQIETWNGYWLWHSTSHSDLDSLGDNVEVPIGNESEETGSSAIITMPWIKIVFSLSKVLPNKIITGYAYVLSKMNSTYGFIKIILPDVQKMYEMRDVLFINESETVLSDKEIEELSTFYNFKSACQLSTIGLKAFEPDKLREFMPKGSILYAQGKEFKFSTEESFLYYQIYKIWIIAMLNKTELLNLASRIASALIELETADERGKKIFSTLSQEVRDSKNIKEFIEKITSALVQQPTNRETFRMVVEEILKMPSDNFPLFITLTRFEYTYQKFKN